MKPHASPLKGRTVKIFFGQDNVSDEQRIKPHITIMHTDHPESFTQMTPEERRMRGKLIFDNVDKMKFSPGLNGHVPEVKNGKKLAPASKNHERYLAENYRQKEADMIFGRKSAIDINSDQMRGEFISGNPDSAIKSARTFLKSKAAYERLRRNNIHDSISGILLQEAQKRTGRDTRAQTKSNRVIKMFVQRQVAEKIDQNRLKHELKAQGCKVVYPKPGLERRDTLEDEALKEHAKNTGGLDDESLLRLAFQSHLKTYLFTNCNIDPELGHQYIKALGFLKEPDLRRISMELHNRDNIGDTGFRDTLNSAIQNHIASSREFKISARQKTVDLVPYNNKDVQNIVKALGEMRFVQPTPDTTPTSSQGQKALQASQKAR